MIEDTSQYARRLSRSFDVMNEIEDLIKQVEGFTVRENIQDQNLSLKQLCARYRGTEHMVVFFPRL